MAALSPELAGISNLQSWMRKSWVPKSHAGSKCFQPLYATLHFSYSKQRPEPTARSSFSRELTSEMDVLWYFSWICLMVLWKCCFHANLLQKWPSYVEQKWKRPRKQLQKPPRTEQQGGFWRRLLATQNPTHSRKPSKEKKVSSVL